MYACNMQLSTEPPINAKGHRVPSWCPKTSNFVLLLKYFTHSTSMYSFKKFLLCVKQCSGQWGQRNYETEEIPALMELIFQSIADATFCGSSCLVAKLIYRSSRWILYCLLCHIRMQAPGGQEIFVCLLKASL